MSQVKITAQPKVGVVAFTYEGDLVLVADGAVVDAGAWEAASKLEALAKHIAKGRLSATPIAEAIGEAMAESIAEPEGVDFELVAREESGG